MNRIKYMMFLGLITIIACQNEPNNPEAIVRAWQSFMDKNDIVAAKTLSSTNTQKWLEGIDAAFGGDTLHVKTEFVNIICEEEGEKAVCKCSSKQNDLNDVYEDVFYLVKENGKWLVDLDLSENIEESMLPIEKDSLK
jgi:hypothetical protein